jgi:hypothetical protein
MRLEQPQPRKQRAVRPGRAGSRDGQDGRRCTTDAHQLSRSRGACHRFYCAATHDDVDSSAREDATIHSTQRGREGSCANATPDASHQHPRSRRGGVCASTSLTLVGHKTPRGCRHAKPRRCAGVESGPVPGGAQAAGGTAGAAGLDSRFRSGCVAPQHREAGVPQLVGDYGRARLGVLQELEVAYIERRPAPDRSPPNFSLAATVPAQHTALAGSCSRFAPSGNGQNRRSFVPCAVVLVPHGVKGQFDFPVGGQLISLLADSLFPCPRPADLLLI